MTAKIPEKDIPYIQSDLEGDGQAVEVYVAAYPGTDFSRADHLRRRRPRSNYPHDAASTRIVQPRTQAETLDVCHGPRLFRNRNQRHSCYPKRLCSATVIANSSSCNEPGSSKSATFNWESPTDSRSKCSAASRNRRPSRERLLRAQIRAVRFADLIACYRRCCRCPSANVSSWSSWPWPWLSEASTRFKPFHRRFFLMSRRSWFRS